MNKPKIENTVCYGVPCICVNDRYLIYLDNGCVYDTIHTKDIPQYVFKIRDKAMNNK